MQHPASQDLSLRTSEPSPSSSTVLGQARRSISSTMALLRSMSSMERFMRNTSKVKQSQLRQSRPSRIQLKRTVTDSHRLGEARSIGRISTTQTDRIGDAFATFNFQYRSRSEYSHKDSQSDAYCDRGSPNPRSHSEKPKPCSVRRSSRGDSYPRRAS